MAMQVSCRATCCGQRASQHSPAAPSVLPLPSPTPRLKRAVWRRASRTIVCSADTEEETEKKGDELENPDSELSRKKDEADRLRAAEKFMKIGTGEAFCKGCGYEYKPSKGDPEYPISAGTYFQDLPGDWQCPICGAEKQTFDSTSKTIAGFAENQGYGFGTNSMTSGQKSLLIYGSLLVFFALFCAGYLLQ